MAKLSFPRRGRFVARASPLPVGPRATGLALAVAKFEPVAVFSGDDAKTLSPALKLGAERAFSKPVDWESLLQYLSNKREAVVEVNRRARERRAASVDALLRQLGWVVMEKPVTWE